MGKSDRLRLPLAVSAVYVLVAGIVQLFPALAEVVFARPVVDPAVESLYGTALLALGGFTAYLAMDRNRSYVPVIILLAAFLLGALDLGFYWYLGQYEVGTVLAPIVLNLFLMAWVGVTLLRSVRSGATAQAH